MLSYYVIYYEMFRNVIQETEKEALRIRSVIYREYHSILKFIL